MKVPFYLLDYFLYHILLDHTEIDYRIDFFVFFFLAVIGLFQEILHLHFF